MKTLPVGIQLYTVRDEIDRDFLGTIKKLKAMGYDYVELAGHYGMEASELKAKLDEAGVKAWSAHVALAWMMEDPDGQMELYKACGCKYIAVPYLPDDERPGTPGFEKTLENMRICAEAAKRAGLVFMYHNHDFEFVKMPDGSFGLDYLYKQIPADLLKTEFDTCWIKVAGQDPVEYLKRYAGRTPVVHLKDFVGSKTENMYALIGTDEAKQESSAEFQFRPVGSGVQDFPAILDQAVKSGAEFVVVEQDSWNDMTCMEAAEASIKYLRSIGW